MLTALTKLSVMTPIEGDSSENPYTASTQRTEMETARFRFQWHMLASADFWSSLQPLMEIAWPQLGKVLVDTLLGSLSSSNTQTMAATD
jgi:hypothetical protein